MSIAATYTPWLRNLGIQDIYLAYLTGYAKIGDLQAVGFGLRYFSLGEIPFTDINGTPLGTGRPNEFEIEGAYARKLSDNLSASLGAKYIYSKSCGRLCCKWNSHYSWTSFRSRFGNYLQRPMTLSGRKHNLTIGAALTNIGSRIAYTESQEITDQEFLPGNLGIGATWDMELDEYNTINFSLDFNKFLVPTPNPDTEDPDYDANNNDIPDFRKEASLMESLVV